MCMKSGVKFFEREHIELVREANHSHWDFFPGRQAPSSCQDCCDRHVALPDYYPVSKSSKFGIGLTHREF